MNALKRTGRRDPGRSRLMPRELEALAFIAQAQPVPTAAYQEFLGVSISVARRSLRKLRDLGLINVFVKALEAPSHYCMTRRAAVLLAETLDRPLAEFRVPRGCSKQHLAHHDGSVELYAALTRAVQAAPFSLVQFQFEEEIRRVLGLTNKTQVPDSVVVWADPARSGQLFAWAVEVDQGTEAVRFVVERKAKPYAELLARGAPLLGTPRWVVVCIVPTEQRLKRLVAALWEEGIPEGQWYFAVRENVSAQTVLSSAWRTVRATPDGKEAQLVVEVPLCREPVITDCHLGQDRRVA